jgi:pimeloyl-ACP methyl ester carboxylesterase
MLAPSKADFVQHAYADLSNGMRLHYAEAGAGPLILFVHGFPQFWYEWIDQMRHFSVDHRTIAMDMRGYGLSSKPAQVSAYKARDLVEDLRLFLDVVGGVPCVMVAHDWGGAVAWSFAAKYPAYLRKLVIINAPHPITFARELLHSSAQRGASSYMTLFRTDKAERVLSENNYARLTRMTLDAWAANGGSADDADRAAYLAAWSQPGALTGGLNYYRASPLHPPESDNDRTLLASLDAAKFRVSVPTRVIWGVRDPALLIGNLHGLEEHVESLSVHRIEDASHWVVHERPELTNRLIREFL